MHGRREGSCLCGRAHAHAPFPWCPVTNTPSPSLLSSAAATHPCRALVNRRPLGRGVHGGSQGPDEQARLRHGRVPPGQHPGTPAPPAAFLRRPHAFPFVSPSPPGGGGTFPPPIKAEVLLLAAASHACLPTSTHTRCPLAPSRSGPGVKFASGHQTPVPGITVGPWPSNPGRPSRVASASSGHTLPSLLPYTNTHLASPHPHL